MKKIFRQISVAGVIGVLLLSSCKDEVIVPVEDNTRADSLTAIIQQIGGKEVQINTELNTITIKNKKLADSIKSLPNVYAATKVQYTVSVISLANAWSGSRQEEVSRTTGLENATVKLTQNGATVSKTTEGGIAVFAGLNPGTVTVTVSAPDHSTLDFTANLLVGESTGDVRNAGSQVYLFPNGASNGATITGKAYANTSTINDTLGRQNWFGTEETNVNYGKYFSKPSVLNISNFSQFRDINYNVVANNIRGLYDNESGDWTYGEEVSWELAPENLKVHVYPSASMIEELPNNEYYYEMLPGYITEYTYRNVIKSGVIAADGSFTVTGIATSNEAGNNSGSNISFSVTGFNGSHKRFTTSNGTANETGSVAQDFTLKDNTALTTTTVNRRTIESNYFYTPVFVMNGGVDVNEPWEESYKNDHLFNGSGSVLPGQTKTLNILFFPIEKR